MHACVLYMTRTHSTHILRASVTLAALRMQTRHPSKDLPIGIVGSLLACSALYAGLALTLCLMVHSLTMPADKQCSLHLWRCCISAHVLQRVTRRCWQTRSGEEQGGAHGRRVPES